MSARQADRRPEGFSVGELMGAHRAGDVTIQGEFIDAAGPETVGDRLAVAARDRLLAERSGLLEELEALRAAVRTHRDAVLWSPGVVTAADLELWSRVD